MKWPDRKDRVSQVVYWIGGAIATLGSLHLTAVPSSAQLTPDASLGAESSIVTPDATVRGVPASLIEGGASRGSNLFHSFSEFNVNTGQAIYFANPIGIENILTRITGGSLSSIDGLLGVDGVANLFLLNPNGVIFGPNAWLDISGSLLVSSADSLVFADGNVFTAVPQANELLSMSVPPGAQLNSPAQADISSSGLLITGQDLSLYGSNLYLEGPLLSGGNLTLYAADTVTIRHAANEPLVPTFVANAGGALTIQGDRSVDIFLQPFGEPALISGGPLTLYSGGEMYANAQFQSGGGSTIFADGDVVFGDYTGASIKIEATGTIQTGNILITGSATTLTADGSGSDEDVLASHHAVIMRAGVTALGDGTLPQPPDNPALAPETAIGQSPGSINVNSIDTLSDEDEMSEDGGVILLMAAGDINTPFLQTRSASAEGNGGVITLFANGRIYVSSVNTLSFERDGGAITFTAGGDIFVDRFMSATTFSPSGNGGAITLTSSTGNIRVVGELFSVATLSDGEASGGTIQLTALAGNVVLSEVELYSYAESGGSTSGSGGMVVLEAPQGSIFGGGSRIYSFALATGDDSSSGNGGEVLLVARDQVSDLEVLTVSSSGASGDVSIKGRGDLRIQNVSLTTSAESQIPNPFESGSFIIIDDQKIGPSGNTFINSIGALTLDTVFISSVARGSQPAGNILIEAPGEVTFINGLVNANTFGQGRGGDIIVRAPSSLTLENTPLLANTFGEEQDGQIPGQGGSILINTPVLALRGESFISARTFGDGAGGNITVQNPTGSLLIRGDGIQDENVASAELSVQAISNTSGRAGLITIQATDLTLENGLQVTAVSGGSGGSEGIDLIATDPNGNVTLNNSSINASTTDQGSGGLIIIQVLGKLNLNASSVLASTTGQGTGGSIALNTSNIDLSNGGQIAASTSGEGNGGSIIFNPGNTLNITGQGGEISVGTSGTGQAGTFADARSFEAGNFLVAIPNINIDGATLSASTTGPQAGGNVNIRTSRLTFANRGQIAASTSGPGDGGSVTVTGNSPLTLQGNGRLTVASENAASGRAGDLNVNASTLSLRDGVELSVNSASPAGGGNINIAVDRNMVMRGGSYINATSTNPNAGDGGNINIAVDNGFLIAAPGQDNDIIANAEGGNGGNINIRALQVYGLSRQDEPNVARLRGNGTNDISASTPVGLEGEIALDTLDVDPSQGLVELPVDLTDRANQVTPGCGLGNSDDGSEFVVTGRGGLPPSPNDPIAPNSVNVPWVVPDEGAPVTKVFEPETTAAPSTLVEAQGIALDAEGNAYFVAEAQMGAVASPTALAPQPCAVSAQLP